MNSVITQNNGHYAVQGQSTNGKPVCDFLCVNNSVIIHSISHRFQIIVHYWSNFRCEQGMSVFNALALSEPIVA